MSQQRIIELQKALRVARTTLEKIAYGHAHNPEADAENALDAMRKLEPKAPLQRVVGH
jgi:hypothetical protein